MNKIFAFCIVSILLLSCDEIDKIFNPSSDYLIEKTVKPSSEEQIIESGSEFMMIFPVNSISGNLEVKVKKESSAPAMNIPNQKLGKNLYRIKFNGDAEFQQPVNIIINFDKSVIPSGKTAQESVFGYIYSSGAWKLADYQIDEPNGKIIISISGINGKINKDEPILLDDGEFIIGDGYTTTDDGNKDNPLAVASLFYVHFTSTSQTYGRTILRNQFYKSSQSTDIVKLTFSGNSFSASYVSDPSKSDADLENHKPGEGLEFNYVKFSLKGEIDNNNYKKFKSFVITESRNYSAAGWAETWYDEKSTLSINDLDLTYESKNKDTLIYEIKDASKSPCIKSFSWFFDNKWYGVQLSHSKTDLTGLVIKFIK